MRSSDQHLLQGTSRHTSAPLSSPHRRAPSLRRSVSAAGPLPAFASLEQALMPRRWRCEAYARAEPHLTVASAWTLLYRTPSPADVICVDTRMARWRSGDAAETESGHLPDIPQTFQIVRFFLEKSNLRLNLPFAAGRAWTGAHRRGRERIFAEICSATRSLFKASKERPA